VIAMTAIYALVQPAILFVPKHLIAAAVPAEIGDTARAT
jgi:hypothetical protein